MPLPVSMMTFPPVPASPLPPVTSIFPPRSKALVPMARPPSMKTPPPSPPLLESWLDPFPPVICTQPPVSDGAVVSPAIM